MYAYIHNQLEVCTSCIDLIGCATKLLVTNRSNAVFVSNEVTENKISLTRKCFASFLLTKIYPAPQILWLFSFGEYDWTVRKIR